MEKISKEEQKIDRIASLRQFAFGMVGLYIIAVIASNLLNLR
jgi:hypothetical protein